MRTEQDRPGYDAWFMAIALVVARRSTCARRAVGCVVVDADNRILSTGYNGVPHGAIHCTASPCAGARMGSGSGLDVCQALHAEQNALTRLERVREARTMYCTTAPCISCAKLAAATGIQRIVFLEPYPTGGGEFWTEVAGREWHQHTTA